jgi:hypothetical protein
MTVATDTIKGIYLVEGQAQKEARSNEWFDQLALNLAGYLSKDVAGAGTVTLTDTVGGEAHHATLCFTGALTGDRTVIVPSAERVYFAGNLTTGAFTLTVTTADGSGAVIPQASWLILVCDGVNVTAPAFTSGSSVPPASETVAGIVELATPAETTPGIDTTRATHPAGVKAALDARVAPSGTALSVARYAASGTALEASPLTLDGSANLGLRTTTPTSAVHVLADEGQSAVVTLEQYAAALTTTGALALRKALGTAAVPGRLPLDAQIGGLTITGYVRNAADSADAFTVMCRNRVEIDSVDAQGRTGARWMLLLSPGASATAAEALRVTQAGNLLLGVTTHGTNLAHGLALGPGTAPTTSPTDTVQLTAVDRGGTAGKRSLQVRTEDGTTHVLGDLSGLGTTLTATLGSGASYQELSVKGSQLFVGQSSVQERAQALLSSSWVVSTDATRTARLTVSAYDATAAREGLRVEADGTAARLGFYGSAAVARPTVSGSRGGNAALASALTALANLGLMTDSSTA